jgi:hypothetical protein
MIALAQGLEANSTLQHLNLTGERSREAAGEGRAGLATRAAHRTRARHRARQTHRQQTHRHSQTHWHTHSQTDTHAHAHTDRLTGRAFRQPASAPLADPVFARPHITLGRYPGDSEPP